MAVDLAAGKACSSTRTTSSPDSAMTLAARSPAGPAPMTRASHWRSSLLLLVGVLAFDVHALTNNREAGLTVGLAVDFHEAFETGAHHAEGCPAFPGQRVDACISGVRVPKKRRRHGLPGGHARTAQSAAPSKMGPRRGAARSSSAPGALIYLIRIRRCPKFWDAAPRRGCCSRR